MPNIPGILAEVIGEVGDITERAKKGNGTIGQTLLQMFDGIGGELADGGSGFVAV
jgi:hypothetical protein